MIKFLLEKEFKQMFRNAFLPRLIVLFPCMVMILMPWAANMEVTNIHLHVVDRDHSTLSRRLVDKVAASSYFQTTGVPQTYRQGLEAIEEGTADMVLEIPIDFEKTWINGQSVQVLVASNAVNGTKGGLGGSYLASIVTDFSAELLEELPAVNAAAHAVQVPQIILSQQNLYNPYLNYKWYMVPALMVMLLTLLCGFLPALNVVSEKEVGTIEQINVTPVPKLTFILAKLLPYWVVGVVVLTICFVLAWLLYGIWPVGNFALIYLFALLFILVMSGFGLVISNHSATMQQAMFVMWFFMLVLILMSGLFTPIRSMPEWAQALTYLNPLMYFMQVMRTVYLKGSGLWDVLPQMLVLTGFAIGFNLWAVKSYQKS